MDAEEEDDDEEDVIDTGSLIIVISSDEEAGKFLAIISIDLYGQFQQFLLI